MKLNAIIALIVACTPVAESMAKGKPLKVFILSGQSNMVGTGSIKTFPAIGMDPVTAPMLKDLLDKDGNPLVCNDVYICSAGDGEGPKAIPEKFGKLEVGYTSGSADKIGPEYAFGIYTHKMLGEPILIIKVARGGRDLIQNFRPPSAGPFPLSEKSIAWLKAKGQDVEAAKAKHLETTGYQYRWMMAYVKNILADPKRVYPDYDPEAGYEIAGFAWLQGFNDYVGGNYPPVEPEKGKQSLKDYSEYTRLLGCFIRDIRKELNAPKLPFVIGVFGMDGKKAQGNVVAFRKAQAATAELPEFKGNVANVLLEDFWPEELDPLVEMKTKILKRQVTFEGRAAEIVKELDETKAKLASKTGDTHAFLRKCDELEKELVASFLTPEQAKLLEVGVSNKGFHYWGSAKFYCRAGKAFAETLVEMGKNKSK